MREEMLTNACREFWQVWAEVFIESTRRYDELSLAIQRLVKEYSRLHCKKSKLHHTGVQPRWSNRTRKKQRLTRLQRRWKRQNRRG